MAAGGNDELVSTIEVWTAKQQQWWYEVAKGSIYSRAVRCRDCRQVRRAKSQDGSPAGERGDPNRIKHVGSLMKAVRAEVEPAILAAGFVFDARNRPECPGDRSWLDYKGHGCLFSVAFEPRMARLVAEILDDIGNCQTIAHTVFEQCKSMEEIIESISAFGREVAAYLAGFAPAS